MAGVVAGWSYASLRLEEFPVYIPDGCSGAHIFFFKNLGIASSPYIGDRLNGELFASKGFSSRPLSKRTIYVGDYSEESVRNEHINVKEL